MIFNHALNNLNLSIDKIDITNCLGQRLECLIQYLNSKKLKTNEDFLNFINRKTYCALYKDFDVFYKKFIKRSFKEFSEHFIKTRENQKKYFNNNLHLIFNKKIWIDHIANQNEKYQDIRFGETWNKSLIQCEKLAKKNNILNQDFTNYYINNNDNLKDHKNYDFKLDIKIKCAITYYL